MSSNKLKSIIKTSATLNKYTKIKLTQADQIHIIFLYYFVRLLLSNSQLMGLVKGEIDGHKVRIYDKDRIICDCLRYRNKMDKEMFNKAIQKYVNDSQKCLPKLLEYSESLRMKKIAKELIGVWL